MWSLCFVSSKDRALFQHPPPPALNISLSRAVSTQGEEGMNQATPLSAIWAPRAPTLLQTSKRILLHLLSHCYSASYFKEILYIQQLAKSLFQEKSQRWWSGLLPRTAEREMSKSQHGLSAGHSWTGSECGNVDNFWVVPQVTLWNGTLQFWLNRINLKS